MTNNKLQSLSERINRLMDEREAIGEDIREIYAEAKSVGYVPRVLRKVIARLRMDGDKRAEEDALTEAYEAALDAPTRKVLAMAASGASSREIEQATGIDHVTVTRTVSTRNSAPEVFQRETAVSDQPGGEGERAETEAASGPLVATPSDDLDIPQFLDRRRA